jgi:hypothetical protein
MLEKYRPFLKLSQLFGVGFSFTKNLVAQKFRPSGGVGFSARKKPGWLFSGRPTKGFGRQRGNFIL